MIKKIFKIMILMGLMTNLNADEMEVKGVITTIDNNAKTILVNNFLIQVMPQTQIKLDDCGIFGTDKIGKFVDLTIGSLVEVEVFPKYAIQDQTIASNSNYIASEIELKCTKNKAY